MPALLLALTLHLLCLNHRTSETARFLCVCTTSHPTKIIVVHYRRYRGASRRQQPVAAVDLHGAKFGQLLCGGSSQAVCQQVKKKNKQ